MIRILLNLLLLFPGGGMWIACLRCQPISPPDTLCLTYKQVDYFLCQDVDAKMLRKDTTFKGDKIRQLNRIILKQTDIIDNNQEVVNLKDIIISKWKSDYIKISLKLEKKDKKLSLFRGGTIIFGCTTLILTGVILLLVK
jgi:hypothetical protein